jgi:hypothetical protein
MFYNRETKRWGIEAAVALTADQLARICDWALKSQEQRAKSIPAAFQPELAHEMGESLAALRNRHIDCYVVDHDRDGVWTPFNSTVRSNESRKVIVV